MGAKISVADHGDVTSLSTKALGWAAAINISRVFCFCNIVFSNVSGASKKFRCVILTQSRLATNAVMQRVRSSAVVPSAVIRGLKSSNGYNPNMRRGR